MENFELSKDLIKSTYEIVKATVPIRGRGSQGFSMEKGIKQGDRLGPLLFIIIMDEIFQTIREQGENLNMEQKSTRI